MSQDYRAAAEAFINRLRRQGAKHVAHPVAAENAAAESKTMIINSPSNCTFIVNNYGVKGSEKGQQQ